MLEDAAHRLGTKNKKINCYISKSTYSGRISFRWQRVYLFFAGSVGLEQVASRVSTNAQEGTFDKVIKMIEDMVNRLQEKASSEATHKAWCDTELAKANKKKDLKERKHESYSTRKERAEAAIDQGDKNINTKMLNYTRYKNSAGALYN